MNDDHETSVSIGSTSASTPIVGIHEFLSMLSTHRLPFTFAQDFEHAGIEHALRHIAHTHPKWKSAPRWLFPGVPNALARHEWTNLSMRERQTLCSSLIDAHFQCQPDVSVKTIQLIFGIEMEEYAKSQCSDCFTPPTMFRAYAASVWVSCVAMSIHLDMQQPRRDGCDKHSSHRSHNTSDDTSGNGGDVHLHLVRCQHSERVACSQIEGSFLTNDESPFAHPLQLLYQRCNQHAMRGWKRSLQALVNTNPGIATLAIDSLITSFTGLHPCISPSLRPHWQARLYIQLVATVELERDKHAALFRMHGVCKESLRRTVAATVHTNIACGVAAKRLQNVMRNYEMPPMGTPHPSMVRNMVLLSRIGSCAFKDSSSLEHAISETIGSGDQVSRSHDDRNSGCVTLSCGSDANTGVAFCERILSACFQSNFVPFWMWASLRDAKPQRLDRTQFDSFHWQLNNAQKLLNDLDPFLVSEVQTIVYKTPEAAVLNVRSTCDLLGIAKGIELPKFVGGRNNTQRQIEYDHSIVQLLKPCELAKLLCFGRMASINEKVMVVQLDDALRTMQVNALLRRHRISNEKELVENLTHLCTISYCTTCNRISNCLAPSYYDHESTCVPFQRAGVYRTSVVPRTTPPKLYCSQRKSAAFKEAKRLQVDSERLCVESQIYNNSDEFVECCESLVNMAHDGTLASRMRRDSKRVMQQTREVESCGVCPMLSLNILGRCVRLNGKWHSLCCYCGNHVEVHAHNRYEGAFCCMHCPDSVPSTTVSHLSSPDTTRTSSSAYQCRLCKKTMRHPRSFSSPHDTFGDNRHTPPHERVTHWCNVHGKPWIGDALAVLPTCIVMAHLSLGTRPSVNSLEQHST